MLRAGKRIRLLEHKPLTRFTPLFENYRNARLAESQYKPPATRLAEVLDNTAENALERGHAIMDSLRDALNTIDERWSTKVPEFERGINIRKVHDKTIAAVSRFVYGVAFGPNETKIKKYNRIKEIKAAIAFMAPRRFGKSWMIAMMCAALFMSVPNIEICIVAQGTRAVGNKSGLLGLIKEILRVCFDNETYEADKENIIGLFPDRRAIHAYSANVGDG